MLLPCGEAQQTPAPPQTNETQADPAGTPKGKVLFERHEAAPATEAEPPPEPPAAATRSRTHKQGLQRRDAMPDATPQPDSPEATEGVSSSSAPAPQSAVSAADQKAADAVPAAARLAVLLTRSDLDMHLNQHTGEVSVHARLVVRNIGDQPLAVLPLQITSALQWQGARAVPAGAAAVTLPYEQHRLTTDADHTGAATEIALTLSAPLAAGATLPLDLFYGGTLQADSTRLTRIGAPAERAAESDWDTVSDNFTGLRGFGNVLWFPVSAPPLLLADGVAFGQGIDAQRVPAYPATMSLRLTLETAGSRAAEAFFLGRSAPLVTAGSSSDGDTSVVQTAEWPAMEAGSHPVSLFVTATPLTEPEAGLRLAGADAKGTEAYRATAKRLAPLLTEWLGPQPAASLQVIALPVPRGQAFADGSLLVVPVQDAASALLAPALVYPLAAARLPATAAPWLRDGLPEFLRLLYLERTEGHDALLADLNASGGVLAREESFRTKNSPALAHCVTATCARTKAAYVFVMLRQLVGDAALQQALTALLQQGVKGDAAEQFRNLLTTASSKDLTWFFRDWVQQDAGLPELSIVSVAPRRVERSTRTDYLPTQRRPVAGPIGAEPVPQAGDPTRQDSATEASRGRVAPADGSWLVAVEVQNTGGAAAEVPVTVRSAGLQNTLPLRIPAHGKATVRVPFEAAPEEVWVNDGSTPEVHSVTHHKTIEIPAAAR